MNVDENPLICELDLTERILYPIIISPQHLDKDSNLIEPVFHSASLLFHYLNDQIEGLQMSEDAIHKFFRNDFIEKNEFQIASRLMRSKL